MDNSLLLPFTLIPGISLLVLSTSNRIYYINSLIREIIRTKDHVHAQDLDILLIRMRHFHHAMVSFYISIALVAIASLIGSIEWLWTKHTANNASFTVDALTGLGILIVVYGTMHLIRESFVATHMLLNCDRTKEIMQRLKEKS